MKVLIFGTGQYYEKYSHIIYENDEVVGLLDNNSAKWNSTIDGVKVYSLDSIPDIQYDRIILLSIYGDAMHKQLLSKGIPSAKVMYWKPYYIHTFPNTYNVIYNHEPLEYKKKVLIITTNLDYNGGSLAAIYAADALSMRGYYVVIAAPDANADFLKEHAGKKINFILHPDLPYVERKNLSWLQEFDIVIVNVLQMIQCACEISQIKPTVWWIHEPGDKYESVYSNTLLHFDQYRDEKFLEKIGIYAVSDIAKKNFQKYFPNTSVGILPYGIPNEYSGNLTKDKEKTVFAVIGLVHERKGQDIFIEAIKKMNASKKYNAEYWIIGKILDNDFGNMIRNEASGNTVIKIWGEMTREQMKDIYKNIDVIVCSSREETMSIVVTEGMMYGKTCIVSDNTGMAAYIEDGENGIICKSGDDVDFGLKMEWCMEHQDELQMIGRKAQMAYESFFTLEKFGERLEIAIQSN